ncbi:VOC family protein [Saccharothrix saharensis]|uniref:VOC family protein n=1 Tax=Saccharothrix saharensis TaxID=571190 RepID=UPI0036B394CA
MKWSHVALNCRDLAATEEFYTRWFGFKRARFFDLGETSIVFLKSGEVYLELFGGAAVDAAGAPTLVERDGPDHVGTVRHLAFQVDDVDALLRQMGDEAQVNLGPIDFDGFIPGWRSVWLTDPDGVVVEVSQGYRDEL